MKNKRSLVADQCCASSVNCCDHRAALSEIARGQSLVTQLRAIVLPALQSDERRDIAANMLEGILDCSRKAMSQLLLQLSSDSPHDDDDHADDKRRVRKIISSSDEDDDHCSSKAADEKQNSKPLRQHKRRRFGDSVSLETPVPHYDGHQWRKYGQKHINNAKHPRSYYRCTYRQEEKCKATKTVQQREDLHYANSDNGDHPIMYTVVYYGQHTCCKGPVSADDHAVVEASQIEISTESHYQSPSSSSSDLQQPAHAGDSSQCSNISVTCSSSVAVEDCNKLLDMLPASDELTTDVLLFDMTAYAPLDMDINWEMDTNALCGFGKFGEW
uniref:WRKY domain-containing protein n=1 Tax=Leersia perrieri TaxID=77586 RepID=A0A0D9XNF2_9ORYZ